MKLIILLSVAACCYADKLDRTYLPPASALTAGGSPGSLVAPSSQSGSASVFGKPSGPSGFDQRPQSGPSGFNQPASGFGQPSGSGSFGQPAKFEQSSQYSQVGASGSQFGPSGLTGPAQAEGPAFGPTRTGFDQAPTDFSGSQEYQPERAGASNDRNAETLKYDNQNDGKNFAYSFETSNGISAEESGVATNGVQAQGGYAYTGDDGQQYRVTYTADENGFLPQGEHLPTPHPIPEEILKSIEENARAAAAGTQEGAYNPDEDFDNNNSIAPQQYKNEVGLSNQGAGPSYQSSSASYQGPSPSTQGSSQPSGQISGSYGQPGQAPSTQYGSPNAPGFAKSSGPQKFQSQQNQYQSGVNQATPARPTTTGFYGQGQRGPEQRSFESDNSGLVRSGLKGQQQDDSGYQYNHPQAPSQASKSNQGGQFRPQPSDAEQLSGSQFNRPQAQGPTGRGFGLTGSSVGQQGFGTVSSPSVQGYAPAGTPQGPSFSRPNTQSQSNGPSGSVGNSNLGFGSASSKTPFGQGYAPAGTPQEPSFSRPSISPQANSPGYSSGSVGPSKQGFGTASSNSPSRQGYAPTDTPQGLTFSRPSISTQTNVPSGYSSGSVGPSKQGFGTFSSNAPSGQGYAPAGAPPVPSFSKHSGPAQGTPIQSGGSGSPNLSQGSDFPRPNSAGSSFPSASPSTSGSTSFSQGSAFAKPNGAATSYSSSGPSLSTQGSRPGSSDEQGYAYGPGKPGSGSPTGRGFGGSPSSSPAFGPELPSGSLSLAGSQQGSFPKPTPQEYSPSNLGPKGPQDFVPTGQSSSFAQGPQGSQFAKPGASSTGPTQTSQASYFAKPNGPSSGSTGSSFSSPQGSFGSAPAYQPGQSSGPKSSMPNSAPYQYNRPGNQGSNTGTPSQSGSQSGFRTESGSPGGSLTQSQTEPRPSESFGGPRQPPSFSPEEGYKY